MLLVFDPVIPLPGIDFFSGTGTYTEACIYKDISVACTCRIGKDLLSTEVLHLDPFSWARTFISSHIGVGCQWFTAIPFFRDLFSTQKDPSHVEMAGRLPWMQPKPMSGQKRNTVSWCPARSRAPLMGSG